MRPITSNSNQGMLSPSRGKYPDHLWPATSNLDASQRASNAITRGAKRLTRTEPMPDRFRRRRSFAILCLQSLLLDGGCVVSRSGAGRAAGIMQKLADGNAGRPWHRRTAVGAQVASCERLRRCFGRMGYSSHSVEPSRNGISRFAKRQFNEYSTVMI